MKKIISLVLAVAMMFALAGVASAATLTNGNQSTQLGDTGALPVTVTVAVDEAPSYYVTVAWDELNFTYNYGAWNPQNRQYEAGAWAGSKNSATVSVTNKSNVGLWYTAVLTDTTNASGAVATLSDAATLEGGVQLPNDGVAKTFTVNVSDPTSVSDANGVEVGKLTVTILASDPTL